MGMDYTRLKVVAVSTALVLSVAGGAARADLMSDSRTAFEAGHREEAFKLLNQAADQGIPKAQFLLGLLYERGRGGAPKDEKKAVEWFMKAALQGDPDAANNLGYHYYVGRGVSQSYDEAFRWYTAASQAATADDRDKSAAWTNLASLYHWGRGTKKDDKKAREFYLKAAELGNPAAQNNVAYLYEHGLGGPVDAAEAARWYKQAAEQGFSVAQGNLGVVYEDGRGMKRDDAQAEAWTLKAARQGDHHAQARLAHEAERGEHRPKDLVEAYKWYLLASKGGDGFSGHALERLAIVMKPDQIAEAIKRAEAESVPPAAPTEAPAVSTAPAQAPAHE
jgi:TPR repeat protein